MFFRHAEGIEHAGVEAKLGRTRATEVRLESFLITVELDVILLNDELRLRLHPIAQSARVIGMPMCEDHVAHRSIAHLPQEFVMLLRAHWRRGVDHHVAVIRADQKRVAEAEARDKCASLTLRAAV